jgi:hypothetical protein
MMRIALSTVIAVGVGLMAAPCDACTCMWRGPLLTVAPTADVVVRARVLRHDVAAGAINLVVEADVLEVLKGSERRSRIRIWGDNGVQCRPYVRMFAADTEWVFALGRITAGEGEGDFAISVCGEHWARVDGDEAVGRLLSPAPPGVKGVPERMTLSELRTRLREAR